MFVISPADGDTSLIPDNRTYKLVFERRTEAAADKVKVSVDGKEVLAKNKYDKENRKLIVTVNASTASKISVAISKDTVTMSFLFSLSYLFFANTSLPSTDKIGRASCRERV